MHDSKCGGRPNIGASNARARVERVRGLHVAVSTHRDSVGIVDHLHYRARPLPRDRGRCVTSLSGCVCDWCADRGSSQCQRKREACDDERTHPRHALLRKKCNDLLAVRHTSAARGSRELSELKAHAKQIHSRSGTQWRSNKKNFSTKVHKNLIYHNKNSRIGTSEKTAP